MHISIETNLTLENVLRDQINNNIKGPPPNPSLIFRFRSFNLAEIFTGGISLFFHLVYCAILGSQLYKKREQCIDTSIQRQWLEG